MLAASSRYPSTKLMSVRPRRQASRASAAPHLQRHVDGHVREDILAQLGKHLAEAKTKLGEGRREPSARARTPAHLCEEGQHQRMEARRALQQRGMG
jgi:hypothetical protein